ncbi:MAG: hypothetical protein DRP91_02830 [Candidatus Neomarinimicrobiota bacterium]|nr:OadG family protein [Candidatus Neomarinimicrobiota bacterium]RKY43774.1 MAG: hypothetical protein DRP88_08890 [Candidatus Neomarinimicrobiota bacterium]RKY50014.1 MAG: hypothetical protein DRP91_02830 [Candidatus Neomarinimicrobiota bacterium]RKY54271.1 MAG: hypothetical protein DRP92_01555 [Candidatus Neomarinimicrobiota bacterium]HDN58918.1 hypothetical protein [Candidatus Neomarinimicrobiota bacterium]
MWSNIVNNNALVISISGILIVFSGLTFIFFVITIFNKIFQREERKDIDRAPTSKRTEHKREDICEEEVVAISIAIDIYRKLYFNPLSTKITFADRNISYTWKYSKTTR